MSIAPTATDYRAIDQSGSPWRRVRLRAGARAVDDVDQRPAPPLPCLTLPSGGTSYVEASGLVLAATLCSASGSGLDRRWLVDAERPTKHPCMEKTMRGVHE